MRLLLWVTTTCCVLQAGTNVSQQCTTVHSFVASLYPGATWQAVDRSPASGRADTLLQAVSWHGMSGFVPKSSIVKREAGRKQAFVGFEVFLSDSQGGKHKLVQCLAYDPGDNKLIGKVPGFPVSGGAWECRGDICDVPAGLAFDTVLTGTETAAAQISYAVGFDTYALVVLVENGSLDTLAGPTRVGDLGGQSGCDISRERRFVRGPQGELLAMDIGHCGTKRCRKICREMGICSEKDTVVKRFGRVVLD
jgi:hypothetical protein